MPRPLPQIIANVRSIARRPGAIRVTLSDVRDFEDLLALCDAAEHYMNRDLIPMSEFIAAQPKSNDATRFKLLSDQD